MLVILTTWRIMKCSGWSRGGAGGSCTPHYCWTKLRSGGRAKKIILGDRGGGGGGGGWRHPPLLLDQTEVRPKGRKNCFGRPPPPPISKGLFDLPPPSPGPLSQGSSSVPRTLFSFLIERVDYLKLPLIIPGLIHFSLIISERTYNRNRKRTSKQAIAMLNVIHLQCEN